MSEKYCLIVSIILFAFLGGCSSTSTKDKIEKPTQALTTLKGCKKITFRPRRFYHLHISDRERLNTIQRLAFPIVDENTREVPVPDYDKAWALLESIIENCTACSKYYLMELNWLAGHIKLASEEELAAVDYFKIMLEQTPHMPRSHEENITYLVAQLSAKVGDYDEAIVFYDKWESLCPREIPEGYFSERIKAQEYCNKEKDQRGQSH